MMTKFFSNLTGCLFLILILFSNSCRQEEILKTNDETSSEALSMMMRTSKDTTGVYLMSEVPIFKNFLKNEFLKHENFNAEEYSNVLKDEQLVDVLNKENRISYSTVVNKGNSTFELLIYTVNGEREQFVSVEFVSENPIEIFDIATFTGTATFKDIHGDIQGTQEFIDGKANSTLNKNGCAWATYEVKCKDGLHWVGQSCAWAGTSDAAYYYTEYMGCDNTVLVQFDHGIDGGGSNGNYVLPTPLAINNMMNQIGSPTLTSQQISFLQNNVGIANSLKEIFNDNFNTSGANSLRWTIDYLISNTNAKNYFTTFPSYLSIIYMQDLDFNNPDDTAMATSSANVVTDILIGQYYGTINNLDVSWPNLEDFKQKVKQAISKGVYTTAKYVRNYVYNPMHKLGVKYPLTITWSNKAIDKIRIDAVTPLVNFNPNTMSWGDLFNVWLFELTPGNFSNNTINFTGASNVVSGNNIYNPNTNAVKNFPKGNNTPGGTLLNIQSKLANGLGVGQTTSGYFKYDVNAFYSTLSNVNLGIQMLGSFPITATVITKSSNTAVVQFHITNDLGWESGTRFIKGTNGSGNQGVIPNKTVGSGLHLGGTITNNFTWTETINF